MLRKNRYITVVAISVGIAMFIIGIIGAQFPPSERIPPCWKDPTPAQLATECREIEAQKAWEKFPWHRQQAEAQDFFRQFQTSVAADRRDEVAGMMMYPLRVTFYTDRWNAQYRSLQSPSELLDVYDKVFDESVKDYVANFDANEVRGDYVVYQTSTGEIGIHPKTLGDCPACTFEFKVESIRSNWIFRTPGDAIFDELFKTDATP